MSVERAIACAINAAENAPDGTDLSGLSEFTSSLGLSGDQFMELLSRPQPADVGGVMQCLNRDDDQQAAAEAQAASTEEDDGGETGDGSDDEASETD